MPNFVIQFAVREVDSEVVEAENEASAVDELMNRFPFSDVEILDVYEY